MISKKLRNSAKGEGCTFNIAGVCNYDNYTTVLCHLPDESNGMGKKSDDISAAFGCSDCHPVADGRVHCEEYEKHKTLYDFRAWKRTLKRWIELGLIKVEGLK